MKVVLLGRSSLITAEKISYCSKISSSLLILSCNWMGTLLAHFCLKTASGFSGKCNDEFTFQSSNKQLDT